MKERFMRALKIYGLIIQVRKTFSLMKMNIKAAAAILLQHF
jgi:hypothetical protein